MKRRELIQRTLLLTAGGALAGSGTVLSGCGPGGTARSQDSAANVAARQIRVTATVGMVADTARRVGGDRVEVTQLMGAGVDPHLYKASQGDIQRLTQADVILYNGLLLEGKMGDIFVKMARDKPTVAVSEAIDPKVLREPPEFQGHYDPHIWFDVSLWSQTISPVAAALSELDPSNKSLFEDNGEKYRAELLELHDWCKEQVASIPERQRILATAHDAFGYFGRAYGIEVVGLQGISTSSEYGVEDIRRMVELITSRGVKAVFVESSVPKRSIEAVVEGCKASGHPVVIGGQLFSDAMDEPGTPAGSYPGMVRHNVETIVKALK